jgi:hypothetical protein
MLSYTKAYAEYSGTAAVLGDTLRDSSKWESIQELQHWLEWTNHDRLVAAEMEDDRFAVKREKRFRYLTRK